METQQTKTTSFKIDPELYKRFKLIAIKKGVNIGDLMHELIENFVKTEKL